MSSLYESQTKLERDYDFQSRVRACVVEQFTQWGEPATVPVDQLVLQLMPEVAAAPGFAAKHMWGDQAAGLAPGQASILDGEILSTVQPLLAPYRTTTGG